MEGDKRFTICRLCLSGIGNLIHVFETEGSHGYAPADVITELLRHKVSSEDIYPQCVCMECMRKLDDFKKFKEQCETCKGLLDRAYASKRISSTEIIHREINAWYDSDREDDNAVRGDAVDADVPLLVPKIELDEGVDWEPGLGDTGVVAENDSSSTKDNKRSVESRSVGGTLAVNQRRNCSFSQKGPSSVIHLTIKPEETTTQDGLEDPLACGDPEDEKFSGACRWKTEPSEPTSEFNAKDGIEDPLACNDSDGLNFSSTCRWKAEHDEPLPYFNKKECTVDGGSQYFNNGKGSPGSLGKKRKRFQCPECGKEYSCPKAHRRHVKEHKFGRNLECEKCGKLFPDKKTISRHMLSHTEQNLNCEMCQKSFKHKNSLRLHMVVHGEKNLKCDECDRAFHWVRDLREHKFSHSKDRKHVCDVCDKTFKNRNVLRLHMIVHTEKNFKCDECNKEFHWLRDLKEHKTTHAKVKVHPCDACGKLFHNKSVLNIHRYTHEGGTPKRYTCMECNRKYPTPSKLAEHMRAHTGEKPFPCLECGQCFAIKKSVKEHMKRRHSGCKVPS